jgi:inosine-uridine nucleoside N-ribohydrolase
MAVLLDPTLKLEVSRHYVAIECVSELARGMTIVDRLNVATDARNSATWRDIIRNSQKPEICWTIDVPRWKAALVSSLSDDRANQVIPSRA